MSIASRLKGAWAGLAGRGAVERAPSGSGSGYQGGPLASDAYGAKAAPSPWALVESYKQIVYSCAGLNAGGVARVPLRLYSLSGGGYPAVRNACGPRPVPRARQAAMHKGLPYIRRAMAKAEDVVEVTNHPLLDALDAVNPFFDYNLLVYYTCLCLDVVGAAYWDTASEDVGGAAAMPREIWPLPAHLVTPIGGPGRGAAILRGYSYQAGTYLPDQLVRFRHVDLRDPYLGCYSPARAIYEYSRLEDEWVSVQSDVLSSPRPALLVSPKDVNQAMSPEAAKRFTADLNRKYARGGAGRAFVEASGNLEVKVLSNTPADLGGLAVSDYDLERMANGFGVPVSLLKSKDVNRANAEAGQYQHAVYGIHPRTLIIAGVMTHRIARPLDPRLFFAFDECVPADQERDARVFALKLTSAELTINEVRAEDGYEEVEWGDEPYIDTKLVQPSKADERAKQAADAVAVAAKGKADAAKPEADKPAAGNDDPPPKKALDLADPAEAEALASVLRVLSAIEARSVHEAIDAPDPGPGDGGDRPGETGPESPEDPPGPGAPAGAGTDPEGGGAEHVQPPGWDADRGPAPEVVPPPGEEGPGHDPGDRGPAAE